MWSTSSPAGNREFTGLRHVPCLGFTLVDFLIALTILGVIAMFMIPKILNSQQATRDKAVFRETLSSLNGIFYNCWLEGICHPGLTNGDMAPINYLSNHLNHVKRCNNSATQGCWTHPIDAALAGQENARGYVLANGVTICGIDASYFPPYPRFDIIIDVNGAKGPNEDGVDQIAIDYWFIDDYPAYMYPWTADSVSLYEEIFSAD